MGTQKFVSIFQLTVSNSFYEGAFSKDLEIVPTQETLRRFADFHLKARAFESGIEVYSESSNGTAIVPIEDIPAYSRFTFLLQTKDSQYTQNTYLDAGQPNDYGSLGNAVYYFDNGLGNDELLLIEGAIPSKVPMSTVIVNYHHPDSGTGDETLDVYGPEDPDGTSTPLLSLTVPFNAESNSYDAQVDLVSALYPKIPAKGKYMFKLGTLDTQYRYVDEDLPFRKPLGIVEIRKPVSNWDPRNNYLIEFMTAMINWRYHFLFRSGTYSPPDNDHIYKVEDSLGAKKFCYGGIGGMDPNHVIFYSATDESSTALPPNLYDVSIVDAAEMAISGINLNCYDDVLDVTPTNIVTNLPNPTAQHLVLVDNDPSPDVIYAEVFVYL